MVVVVVVVVVVQQGTIIANTTEEQSEQQQAVRYARYEQLAPAQHLSRCNQTDAYLIVITIHHPPPLLLPSRISRTLGPRAADMRATSLYRVCVCVCRPRRPTHEAYIPPGRRRRSNAQRESAGARQPSSPTRAQQRAATTNSGGATRATAEEKRRDKRGERRKVSLSQTEPLYRERANNRNALSRYPRLPRPLTLVRFSTSSWLSYAVIECVLVVDLASRVVSFVSRSPSLVALLLPACLRVSLSPFLCVCTYVRSLLARCLAWCGVWCERTPNLDPSTSTSTLPLVCRVLARARCCCWD